MNLPRALGDDRIEDENESEILLVCPVSKGWGGRTARSAVRAAHPGTAVGWEDRIYEVLAAEPRSDGTMRYRLAPWAQGMHALAGRMQALARRVLGTAG